MAQGVDFLKHGGQCMAQKWLQGFLEPSAFPLGVGGPPYLGIKHNLWGPVPACGHVFCQESSVVMLRIGDPGQAKITDLESNPGC